jgi:hypothetical protein
MSTRPQQPKQLCGKTPQREKKTGRISPLPQRQRSQATRCQPPRPPLPNQPDRSSRSNYAGKPPKGGRKQGEYLLCLNDRGPKHDVSSTSAPSAKSRPPQTTRGPKQRGVNPPGSLCVKQRCANRPKSSEPSKDWSGKEFKEFSLPLQGVPCRGASTAAGNGEGLTACSAHHSFLAVIS